MRVDSLEELTAAFEKWREKKKHAREAVPQELLERAQRTARVHGARRVTLAAKVDGRRLKGTRAVRGASRSGEAPRMAVPVPAYSRVELSGTGRASPLAEVEMPSGVKVRVYAATEELLSLVARMCAEGGR